MANIVLVAAGVPAGHVAGAPEFARSFTYAAEELLNSERMKAAILPARNAGRHYENPDGLILTPCP